MMNEETQVIPYHFITGITFNVYSSKEVQKLSVLEVTNLKIFDDLGHATAGGLHDPLLGPTEPREVCHTCGLSQFHCSGHVGHISLPLPVFNPFLLGTLHKLLRGTCFNCHSLLAMPIAVQLTLSQLHALDYGLVGIAQDMQEMVSGYLTEGAKKAVPITIVLELKTKFANYMEEALKGLDKEEARNSSAVKNVVECRQRIVKNFMVNHLMKSKNKCYYCHSKQRRLALYNYICFVFRNRAKEKNKSSDSVASGNKSGSEDEEAENFDPNFNITDLTSQNLLTALEARDHLRNLWNKEKPLLQHLFGILDVAVNHYDNPMDVFFIEHHLVTPTRFRPISFLKGRKYENPQTAALKKVLQYSIIVREILSAMKKGQKSLESNDENMKSLLALVKGRTLTEKLYNARNSLQLSVNSVADNEMDKFSNSKDKLPGKKQILEKKEGVFRKHMMGKRVDYAARSVISPDPYIMMDEVGVPEVFAKKLTYPQPVTPWNVRELRQIVMNGPNIYPGAVLVKRDDGLMVKLSATNHIQREAIAKRLLTPDSMTGCHRESKIVYRHLRTGDCLLLNRQPTLHKPSIMAHRARVLPKERTLRLHYANCKTYNADFDGDEMNAHLPQNEIARSEGYNIASVNNQYLVPKDGTPLSGLIQDHVIAGSLLSMRGNFFSRADYNELIFGALTFIQRPLKLLPPCILKPEKLWSGKQIISTIIINIIPPGKPAPTVEGKAKIALKNWQNTKSRTWSAGGSNFVQDEMSESEVIIRSGELLCGVLDKAHYGPTPYGLVHCCYELYGGQTSMVLLTSLTRLFTHYLALRRAFTLGVEDIIVTPKANKKRQKIMKSAKTIGDEIIASTFDVVDSNNKEDIKDKYQRAHLDRDDRGRKQLDAAMKSNTDRINNKINQVCIPNGLIKKFPDNNLQLMIQSGSKGSSVNAMQISCLLGQIELEGRRVPLMPSGRSAPSFIPYDTSPRAGGFVDGRFLTGLRPQEYFFHCMAGREGLVDTAVKTSRSGYLQRCLIKHLEGLVMNYDMTVRDSDGSVVQFQYGEDGLDIQKMQMLKKEQFPTLIKNYEAAVKKDELEELTSKLDLDSAKQYRKKLKKWSKKRGNVDSHQRVSGFTMFSTEFLQQLRTEHPGRNEATGCEYAKEKLCQLWHELDADATYRFNKPWIKRPDPLSSQLRMDTNFGSISEKLDAIIENYISDNPDNLIIGRESSSTSSNLKISRSQFRYMMYLKHINSLAEPGEAVGLLAAQSIGEPSTQMTLNTFHFAGRGEMNVTLGIPRLREILMTASSNIATPCMDLPLLPLCDAEEKANELRIKFTAVTLAQVLEKIKVTEHLKIKGRMNRFRQYRIHFKFLPHKAYKKKFFVNPSMILKFMETSFIKKLVQGIKKKMQHMKSSQLLMSAQKRYSALRIVEEGEESPPAPNDKDDGESSDDGGEGDDDTTSAKQKDRHEQEQEYDEADEELVESQSGNGDNIDERGDDEENMETEENLLAVLVDNLESTLENKVSSASKKCRINNVLKMNPSVIDYDFDTKHEQWCEVELQLDIYNSKIDMTTLVEEEAHKALVHETPGISRAFLVDDNESKSGSQKMLKTEGVNIQEMFKYEDILDVNRIYSNDIHAIARTYGIEAAARVIVKEVKNVFAAYGIIVDLRHLLLVADYMTFDGTYKPCNRYGMESSASPIQQMTFETTMKFLNSATLNGYREPMKSPSARLAVGNVVSGGTGSFELFQPILQLTNKKAVEK